MPKQSYGNTTQQRAQILLLALVDFANDSIIAASESELTGLRSHIQAHWQTDKQLVIRTKARYLVTLVQLMGEQLSIDQIKTALKHLDTVVGMLTDNRTMQRGSENWHFTLTFDHNRWERTAHQQAFDRAWTAYRNAEVSSTSHHQPQDETWTEICRSALNTRLTSNVLTAQVGISFDLGDVYVPLGIMERSAKISEPMAGAIAESEETTDPIYQPAALIDYWLAQPQVKRIAIIGEPGIGKTTLLQKVALGLPASQLPIWISLADLEGQSIGDYLTQTWLKEALQTFTLPASKQADFVQVCQQGQVWLLLDAVDEMGIHASLALTQLAKQLRGWLDRVNIVLTCRLNLWEGEKNALADFSTYRSLGFNHPHSQHQVGAFIQRWFSQNPQLGITLSQALERPGLRPVREVVQNPLYLALLCRTWTLTQGRLPSTKAILYRQFVDAFYDWKQDLFPTTLKQRQQLQKFLADLALQAMQQPTPFRLSYQLVYQCCQAIDPDLMTLALQLGWLKQAGISTSGDKMYAFYHPTFQEYFAAQAVTDGLFFVGKFPLYKWQEVVLLWLGRADIADGAKEDLLQALETFADQAGGFFSYRTYFLAAEGLAEFPRYSNGQSMVKQLVQWRFGFGTPPLPATLVERAGIALSRSARSLSIPALENFLHTTTDPLPCWLAAHSLGKNHDPGNPTAIATLEKLLQQPANANLQVTHLQVANLKIDIAKSLGIIDPGNPVAIDTLINLINTNSSAAFQRRAAQRLAKIDPGNKFALHRLQQLVTETTDPHLRSLTIDTLTQLQSQSESLAKSPKKSRRSKQTSPDQLAPEKLIAIFVQKLDRTQDPLARLRLAHRIAQLDLLHPLGVAEILQGLVQGASKPAIKQAAESLRELVSIEQLPTVLPPVRNIYLAPTNNVQYQESFKLLWYWSRLLSYQDFSRLWSSECSTD